MSVSEVFKSLGINEADTVGVFGSIGEIWAAIRGNKPDELTLDMVRELYEDLTISLPSVYESGVKTDDELGRKRKSKAALRNLKNILAGIESTSEYVGWLDRSCELRAKQDIVTPVMAKNVKMETAGAARFGA